MLAGETDFLLKIVASDWDSYQRFLSARLTAAPNVAHVKSALVLRVSKSAPGVPVEGGAGRGHPDRRPAAPRPRNRRKLRRPLSGGCDSDRKRGPLQRRSTASWGQAPSC